MLARFSFIFSVFAAAASVVSADNNGGSSQPSDAFILQYALTLEHLEAAFYKQALQKFSDADFAAAGYTPGVRQRVMELALDEATHVAFLTSGLQAAGAKPVKACTYDFSAAFGSVDAFLAYSRVLEGVGVSAYLGAAADISNKDYLTAAGAILTVEARHQAVITEVNQELGFPSPFDTPLKYNDVYSLAAPFFKSCPKSNFNLGLTAFPGLTFIGTPTPGNTVKLSFPTKKSDDKPYYAYFFNQLSVTRVKISNDKTVKVPKGLTGTIYVAVVDCETYYENKTKAFGLYQIPTDLNPIVQKSA